MRVAVKLWGTSLAIAGAFALSAPSALASTYSVTNLGSLGDGITFATGINNNGQVTGYSYLGTAVQIPCHSKYGPKVCFTHPYHAFLYSGGVMTDLGTLGGLDSRGNAINNLGEVVGTSALATGSSAFTDQGGAAMTAINTGDPMAINDSGEIAGEGSFLVAGTPGDIFEQAFTYQSGKTTVLGLLPGAGGSFTGASGINASGEVVGSGDNAASDERAWEYLGGVMSDIGTLGGPQASAAAINAGGQIVGSSQTSTDADDGFLYQGGKMTDLGLNVLPDGINIHGVIVGEGPGGAFVGTAGHLQNLNSLVSGYTLTNAVAINDNGQIVAQGNNNTSGQGDAFLLTPS